MNFMNDEYFVDTNILVYAFDLNEPAKRKIAQTWVNDITCGKKKGMISNQVLGELFAALTKKPKNFSLTDAQIIVNGLIESPHWHKVNYHSGTIKKAMNQCALTKNGFWDTLMMETAVENQSAVILTENTKDFQHVSMRVVNPFKTTQK